MGQTVFNMRASSGGVAVVEKLALFTAGCSWAALPPVLCTDQLQRQRNPSLLGWWQQPRSSAAERSALLFWLSSDSAEPAPSVSALSVLARSVQSTRCRLKLGLVALLAGRELRWLLLLFAI